MKLNVKAFGLAVGVVWGLIILAVTLVLTVKATGGEHISRLNVFYPGYDLSYLGALIGLVWSLVYGFVAGAILAWVYNKVAGDRYSR
jgi:hypothetical protein